MKGTMINFRKQAVKMNFLNGCEVSQQNRIEMRDFILKGLVTKVKDGKCRSCRQDGRANEESLRAYINWVFISAKCDH